LLENECECGDFYQYQSPCSHAIAVARYLEIDPLTLFDISYSVRVYNRTYSRPVIPVSIQGLTPDESIKPPILKKQAGRPKTKRIRKGSWQKKQTRCGNCLEWGHNKRRCTGQPVSSGRRERARDWLSEVQIIRQEEEEEEEEDEEEDEEGTIEEEEGDKQSDILSDLESSQFDRMDMDNEEEEEALVSYTRSGLVRR